MKFCKDCKHHSIGLPFFWEPDFDRCDVPVNESPVRGPVTISCTRHRTNSISVFTERCGVDARFFEPK